MVLPPGIEPGISYLEGSGSIHLSYGGAHLSEDSYILICLQVYQFNAVPVQIKIFGVFEFVRNSGRSATGETIQFNIE